MTSPDSPSVTAPSTLRERAKEAADLIVHKGYCRLVEDHRCTCRPAYPNAREDYFATANPSAILELLDERDALLRRVGELEGALDDLIAQSDGGDSHLGDCATANCPLHRARAALSEGGSK